MFCYCNVSLLFLNGRLFVVEVCGFDQFGMVVG